MANSILECLDLQVNLDTTMDMTISRFVIVERKDVSRQKFLVRHCIVSLYPEQVIIGGEFSKVGEYLLPPVISAVRKYTLNLMYKDSDIVLSELKEKANVIGSSLLSRSKLFALE